MVMLTVEPELVSVAEPRLTVQLADSGEPGQEPVADTVWVAAVAVKVVLPGTSCAGPLQVSVKV